MALITPSHPHREKAKNKKPKQESSCQLDIYKAINTHNTCIDSITIEQPTDSYINKTEKEISKIIDNGSF